MTHEPISGKRWRLCMLDDRITAHGPVVEIDERGRERLVGRSVHGKREGRWVATSGGVTTEATYKNGLPEGRIVMRDDNSGLAFLERWYRRGQLHGKSTFWWENGNVSRVQYYERNKPTGTWEWYAADGSVRERHQYGADGVLLAIDGRPVPPPPSRLELPDGSVIERELCVRIAEEIDFEQQREGRVGCLELFERYQKCSDDACRSQVVAEAARRKPELVVE